VTEVVGTEETLKKKANGYTIGHRDVGDGKKRLMNVLFVRIVGNRQSSPKGCRWENNHRIVPLVMFTTTIQSRAEQWVTSEAGSSILVTRATNYLGGCA